MTFEYLLIIAEMFPLFAIYILSRINHWFNEKILINKCVNLIRKAGYKMPITLVVVIRSIIAFFVLLLLVRLIGKQQVAQLTFFDYVLGITIGSIASTLSVQVNENTLATLVGMAVWAILTIMLGYLDLHNTRLRKLIS